MADLYDDTILKAAYEADFAEWGKEEHGGNTPPVEASAKAILDAAAPLIAAKAVRQAARDLSTRLDAERISRGDLFSAMSSIADQIEEKAK